MEIERLKEILKDYKNKSNKDITQALDFLYEDFNTTKETILKLTYHLDSTEINYNKLLDEMNNRISNVG
jgi:hypothetical protein